MHKLHTPSESAATATRPPRPARALARLQVTWARQHDELRAAQALRWRVFADEMGATLLLQLDDLPAACRRRFLG